MQIGFRIERWHSNLAAIWIAQLVSSIGFSFIFPFIPLFVQDLGIRDPTAAAQWSGLIGSASALSMTVVQPIWGNLADRFGRKPMVIRAMVGGGIIISLMSLASTPEQLLVLRF